MSFVAPGSVVVPVSLSRDTDTPILLTPVSQMSLSPVFSPRPAISMAGPAMSQMLPYPAMSQMMPYPMGFPINIEGKTVNMPILPIALRARLTQSWDERNIDMSLRKILDCLQLYFARQAGGSTSWSSRIKNMFTLSDEDKTYNNLYDMLKHSPEQFKESYFLNENELDNYYESKYKEYKEKYYALKSAL